MWELGIPFSLIAFVLYRFVCVLTVLKWINKRYIIKRLFKNNKMFVIKAVENSFFMTAVSITVIIWIISLFFTNFSFDSLVLILLPVSLTEDLSSHEHESWFILNQLSLPILARGEPANLPADILYGNTLNKLMRRLILKACKGD